MAEWPPGWAFADTWFPEIIPRPGPPLCLCHLRKALPRLPGFLSTAANRGHGTERAHTSVTTLHQTQQLYDRARVDRTDEAAWEIVREQLVDETRLSFSEAKDYVAFCAAWCGGDDGAKRLASLSDTEKCAAGARVEIPSNMLGALARINWTSAGDWVFAILDAILLSPAPTSSGKAFESRLFSPADASQLTEPKTKERVEKGIAILKEALDWESKQDTLDPVKMKMIHSDLASRLTHFVHNKKVRTRKQYTSMDEIKARYVEDVKEAFGTDTLTRLPFGSKDKGPTQGAAAPTGPVRRDFKDGHMTTETLVRLGFHVGCSVEHKEDKALTGRKVKEFKGHNVVLTYKDGKQDKDDIIHTNDFVDS